MADTARRATPPTVVFERPSRKVCIEPNDSTVTDNRSPNRLTPDRFRGTVKPLGRLEVVIPTDINHGLARQFAAER